MAVQNSIEPRALVVRTRKEADDVIDGLKDIIRIYGWATLLDFYELVRVTGTFFDNKWGWKNLDDAHVEERGQNEFVFVLPDLKWIS